MAGTAVTAWGQDRVRGLFVDTSAWYALANAAHRDHDAVARELRRLAYSPSTSLSPFSTCPMNLPEIRPARSVR